MRLILLIAVIALLVDALVYSGAYTQGAFRQVALAAEEVTEFIGDLVDYGPNREGSPR